jgi:putative transposase
MSDTLKVLLDTLRRCFRSQRDLILENLALRQQLGTLARRHTKPQFTARDRFFWIALRRLWPGWRKALILVQPDTVIGWHRSGFRLYWKWLSRKHVPVGRKPTSPELRQLIFQMVRENPGWGAPRIHGELKMLGFEISERTVLRWMRKAPRDVGPAKRWTAFLSNHREAIAAMDFFTVPTLGCGLLYCFFIIHHAKRRILQCNITSHPTAAWVSQQLREAFPYDSAPQFLIFDREHTFEGEVMQTVGSLGIRPVRTAVRSPWQNGIAERWVGSCRRELLDNVIVLNRCHLKRLMTDYIRYYHDDRTHLGLGKNTPTGCESAQRAPVYAKIISMSRLGGLHHRYDLAA